MVNYLLSCTLNLIRLIVNLKVLLLKKNKIENNET